MQLQMSTWPEVEAYLETSRGIILPIGSTEQHGPTGLIGTDALTAEFIGRRLGGYMMESLLRQAWQPAARRITLDTCDLDHPAAIPFYRRHGFVETRSEVCSAEDPREAGILPRAAAPHIPLNRQL